MVSDKQLKFCRNVVNGDSSTEAYLKSYPSCRSRASARSAAPRLLANVSVRKKIRDLRNSVESSHILTWLDKRKLLASIIRNWDYPAYIRLKAIEIDNKMAGHDKPPEPESDSQLDKILEQIRSKKD